MASRIGKTEWTLLYVVTGILDLIELVFPPAAVIDPFIGPALFIYFQSRGVSMFTRISRLVSLLTVWVSGSVLVSVEPFWILDIWYIHRSVKAEEVQDETERKQAELLQNRAIQPLYQDGMRMPPPIPRDSASQQPLNNDGIRPPHRRPPPLPSGPKK